VIIGGGLWLLACHAAMAGGASPVDDHQQAVAALTDVKAALGELVRADASYAADPKVYHGAAQRAINALGGTRDENYVAGAGTSGDAEGAVGHIDALLDRTGTLVWTATVESAEANIRAAISHLLDAKKSDELLEYATAASRAIDYLEVARGRPNETGVFGGLEGVLANTELGVPAGANREDACQAPAAAPSYGTHGGYIAWVAVPAGDASVALPQPAAADSVSVQHGMVVLHTAAMKLVADACAAHAKADPPGGTSPPVVQSAALAAPSAAAAAQAAPSAAQVAVQPAPAPPRALYTQAQAERGEAIFATKCVSCHGANLQGTAAPSVAGNDFLVTAQHNGWTLEIMRYIVFQQMPRNSPASLSPPDDAAVMAYLLASNCYPAGSKPFPAQDDPAFGNIKLGPVPGQHAGQDAKGVCKLN